MLCFLVMPLLALVGVALLAAMRCSAPGPLLFRQERVGLNGRRFTCLKFRTMKVNADTAVHQGHCAQLMRSNAPMTKMDARGDTRLIPGGWLLRASGLDELPQVINVLRGEMSVIGPRPCTTYEYDNYEAWQRMRFHAVPGLTGLWQVSGKNRTTFEQMVKLDIQYATNLSPWMDLKILALTPTTLIGQLVETRRRRAATSETRIPSLTA